MDIGFQCLSKGFQISNNLNAALDAVEVSAWLSHVNRACYEGEWQVLPLRGLSRHAHSSPILQAFALEESDSEQDYQNYSVLEQFPALELFLSQLCCPILSARLMKLEPGARILPHRDKGLCFSQGQARLHLVLTTDPDVEFVIDGEKVQMQAGELWYLNADREHSVNHKGTSARIHLVIDCLSNDWLSNQLGLPEHQDINSLTVAERQAWLRHLARTLVECPVEQRYGLRPPVREFATSLANLVEIDLAPSMFVNDEFTLTGSGKAVSMLVAAKCAEEYLRTAQFVRGIHQAIDERINPNQPVRVLYAGTGPFATLLLPQMALFSSQQLQVTLLDIHQHSLEKLTQIISAFELDEHVEQFVCADATQYQPDGEFDLIVSETMKAGLDEEPQVAIFSNLVRGLKESGSLIPEKVEVAVCYSDEQGRLTPSDQGAQLDQKTASALARGDNHALDISLSRLPASMASLHLATTITVYGEHVLSNRDCSLNLLKRVGANQQAIAPVQEKLHPPHPSLRYQIGRHPGYQLESVTAEQQEAQHV